MLSRVVCKIIHKYKSCLSIFEKCIGLVDEQLRIHEF